VVDKAEMGEDYTVSEGAFSMSYHFNGQRVTALEDSGMWDSSVDVRCHCCGDTITCYLSDLND
jgi:hypothetical protein